MTTTNKTKTSKRCFACDRRAVAAWQDKTDGHRTHVCEAHRWIAVAATGNATCEYINLRKERLVVSD